MLFFRCLTVPLGWCHQVLCITASRTSLGSDLLRATRAITSKLYEVKAHSECTYLYDFQDLNHLVGF